MKEHTIYSENRLDYFVISEFKDGHFSVYGNRKICQAKFKEINKRPPNEFGVFLGHEKAGYNACRELINKYKNTDFYIKKAKKLEVIN